MPDDSAVDKAAPVADGPLSAESLQVSLTVADARRSAAWYRDVLGFTVDREFERDSRLLAVAALDAEPVEVWGARVFRLRDPDGFRLVVSSPREA